MNQEIERKFIIDPANADFKDLVRYINPIVENRYYLFRKNGVELRFTSLASENSPPKYTLDRLEVLNTSLTVRSKERWHISEAEFNRMLDLVRSESTSIEPIIRHSYTVSDDPKIEIKMYDGKFYGLVRAEVEFGSVADKDSFQTLPWMGEEISGTPIGNDVTLAELSTEDCAYYVNKFLA